jgi:hypothetical protein
VISIGSEAVQHPIADIQIGGSAYGYLASFTWLALWFKSTGRPVGRMFMHRAVTADVRIRRDEGRRITVCLTAGRYGDGNVRAARQGIVDAPGIGPSGGY